MSSESRVVTIRAIRGIGGFNLFELVEYKDLLRVFITRDIRLRYKQASLGVLWVVLQPLIAAALFAIIFGVFGKIPTDGQPYLLIAFLGIIGWQIVGSGLTKAGPSLVSNATLVGKVFFPRILLPVSACLGVLLDLVVGLVLAAIMMLAYHVAPTWHLLLLPLFVLELFLTSIGAGLLLSAVSVYNRDFIQALPFVLQIWMYASPVIYPLTMVPHKALPIYSLNPAVLGVQGIRWSILGTGEMGLTMIVPSLVMCAALLLVGLVVFRLGERKFADVI